jgi:hypothetical protein
MRKTLIALALLFALAAVVPGALAGGPPTAADPSPAPNPSPAAAQPAADFALWLEQSAPGTNRAGVCTANICNFCASIGEVCCSRNGRCDCASSCP